MRFYEYYFAELANEHMLPIEYFKNPFKKRALDSKEDTYTSKKMKGARNYYKLVFSTNNFKQIFENYVNNELLEDYLLQIPYKLYSILCDSFYYYTRDDDIKNSWNFPWSINEVELAIKEVNKSLF